MTQSADDFLRAMSIFDRVCDLPPDEQSSALDAHCDGNEALRDYVKRMLLSDDDDDAVLAESMQGAGAMILADELTESTPDADIPKQIGRYKITREIGRGGMGVVYEAEQENPNRTVALKILPPGFGNPSVLRRFQREADMLGRMRHPGITQIFEAGVAELQTAPGMTARQPFIAMELVPGLPLDRYARENEFSVNEKLRLFATICDAIQHAHDNGVIHRDLKPNNILVESNGQPKVLDFGVSRATHADMLAVSLQTHTGQIVGTIPYMSPEQVQGDPDAVDERSDVYSLGVVLYELLAGRLPHDLKNRPIVDAIRVIQEEEPSRLGSIDRAFRGDIETILCKSLEKEKDRRYASPAAIAADIRRYLAHEPLQARPVSSFYQLRKFTRRNKTLVLGIAMTMAACLIGAVIATVFGIRANHNARLASERESNARKASYRASISAAAAALRENDIATAERHLRTAPESLRNWDWEHLSSRLDQSLASASFLPQRDNFGHEIYARGYVHVWFGADGEQIYLARLNPTSKTLDVQSWITESLELSDTWSIDDVRCFAPSLDSDRLVVILKNSHASIRRADSGKSIRQVASNSDTEPLSRTILPQKVPESFINAWESPFQNLLDNGASPTHIVSSPGEQYLAGWNNNHISLFSNDGSHRSIPVEQHSEGASNAVFSPDGRFLVTTGFDRRLALYDIEGNGRRIWEKLDAHRDAILAVAISPDGTTIVTGGEDRVLKAWDTKSGKLMSIMVGHCNPIYSVSFSNEGRKLVSASADRVFVWSMETSEDLSVMKGHDWIVSAMAISPDGSILASSANGIFLWDVQTGFLIARLPLSEQTNRHAVSFSVDGRRLLIDSVVIDMRSGEQLARLEGSPQEGHQFDPTGRIILGTTQRRTADSYSILSEHPKLGVWSFEPSGRLISSAAFQQNTLSILELDSFDLVRQWTLPIFFASLLFDSNRTVAVARRDFGISLLDVESGNEKSILHGHSDIVTCIARMPVHNILISGSQDRTVRLWNLESLDEMIELRGHLDTVHALAVTPDGRTVFSASGDYTIRRWGAESLRGLAEARVEYREISDRLSPMIDALFAQFGDPVIIAEQIEEDASLSPREREIARQIVLRRAIESQS